MRVTVCELPYAPASLAGAWSALCDHVRERRSDLVVLPELAFGPPVWIAEQFDPGAWREMQESHARWLPRLGELGAQRVIGTRPVTEEGGRFNDGFLWSRNSGFERLRRKHFLPNEPEAWEGRWFAQGDAEFPRYAAGELSFGLNVCTELWALETFGAYRRAGVAAIVAPRATAGATTAKWLAVGTVAAVSAGAYCLSSNRVHDDGSCGGVGWVIDPDGVELARTSPDEPAVTVDVEPARAASAAATYPRYVFSPR